MQKMHGTVLGAQLGNVCSGGSRLGKAPEVTRRAEGTFLSVSGIFLCHLRAFSVEFIPPLDSCPFPLGQKGPSFTSRITCFHVRILLQSLDL